MNAQNSNPQPPVVPQGLGQPMDDGTKYPTDINKPMLPMDNGANTLSEDEMRSDLENGLKDVQGKNEEVDMERGEFLEKMKSVKIELVRKLFDVMKEMGVDGSSLESINKFLGELKASDPDLLELFENALNGLSPEDMSGGIQGAEMPPMPTSPEEDVISGVSDEPSLVDKYSNIKGKLGEPQSPELSEPQPLEDFPEDDMSNAGMPGNV